MECKCPDPSHHDGTPSFKIYGDERAFCFGCGWKGDVIDYIQMRDVADFSEALRWLETNMRSFPRTGFSPQPDHRERTEASPSVPTETEKERMISAAQTLAKDPQKCASVAATRGWSQQTIQELAENQDLGWYNDRLSFIFATGMKVREWPGRDFRWNCGKPSLWRSPDPSEPDTIFVTEGETDAISLIDAGVELCGGMVCALPSASTIRADWFSGWTNKKVVLCFDNDKAGMKATADVAAALQGITDKIRVVSFSADPSINDISDAHQKIGRDDLMDWLEKALRPLDNPPGGTDEHVDPTKPTPSPAQSQATAATPPPSNGPAGTPDSLPPLFYETGKKEYYLQAEDQTWIPVNENSAKRHLKGFGYRHGKEQSGSVTPLEQCLNQIQTKHGVAYAAPLAGYPAGFHEFNGKKILVTTSPKLVEPIPGDFPILTELLKRMFVTEAKDQRPYLYGWLKVFIEALRANKWRQGQALAMCGPVDCGKSLLQGLFTLLFGGRSAKPHQFMTGGTLFNEDLFEGEHLMIEDDAESTQHAQRKTFGAFIKGFSVNKDQRCHGKSKKGLILKPLWRLSISLNDEPQRLMVLPPIDQDIEDKIILLKVNAATMPMPLETDTQRELFWNTLVSELPAFVHFLLTWEIPEELRSARFGIRHYHHPDILSAVDEVSNEQRLMDLIDEGLSFPRGEAWKGTASDLERALGGEKSGVQYESRKLFYFNNACGTYLASLARKAPDRVQKLPRNGNSRPWQINPLPGRHYTGQVFTSSTEPGNN